MRKRIKLSALAMVVFLVGCAVNSEVSTPKLMDALTPRALTSSEMQYDKKVVVVRGVLYVDADAICLVEPEFADAESPPSGSEISVLGLDKLDRSIAELSGKEIIFSGVFFSDVTDGSGFLRKGCGRRGVVIEDTQHVEVRLGRRKR